MPDYRDRPAVLRARTRLRSLLRERLEAVRRGPGAELERIVSRAWTARHRHRTPSRVFQPATGELVGSVPITAPGEVQAVVEAVAKVQPFWAQLTLEDRGRYLERAAQVVIDEGDEIRDLIVARAGQARNEAFAMEVLPTIDALSWIAHAGPGDPRGREDPDAAAVPEDQGVGVHVRAAGRDRGHLAVELPVEHPLR